MTPELLEAIRFYAGDFSRETCGVLVASKPNKAEFVSCNNLSKVDDKCEFCAKDMARAEDRGKLIGYVHTHSGHVIPSPADKDFCRISKKPWWIVSQDDWARLDTALPFTGRTFAWGVQDCFTLMEDWYSIIGVKFPNILRESSLMKSGVDSYMKYLPYTDFELVNEEPKFGDAILLAIQSIDGQPNHAAVHVGEGNILHHLPNRLSMVELYDGDYRAATKFVARRKK